MKRILFTLGVDSLLFQEGAQIEYNACLGDCQISRLRHSTDCRRCSRACERPHLVEYINFLVDICEAKLQQK